MSTCFGIASSHYQAICKNICRGIVTLEVKVKVKLSLEQATKAQRESRGIAVP
jgi:hypothetical protein